MEVKKKASTGTKIPSKRNRSALPTSNKLFRHQNSLSRRQGNPPPSSRINFENVHSYFRRFQLFFFVPFYALCLAE